MESFDRSIDLLVSRLRQKLADDPREPKMIKTVRGAGYLSGDLYGQPPCPNQTGASALADHRRSQIRSGANTVSRWCTLRWR